MFNSSNCFNLAEFDLEICSIVKKNKSLSIKKFGVINGYPIYMIKNNPNTSQINVLIMAGFHGDEPGGCLGILNFLRSWDIENEKINISIIPWVNPTGLVRSTRLNQYGEDPNRGFYKSIDLDFPISLEGDLLKKNLPEILQISKDGFLSLHEDVDEVSEFYLYTFDSYNHIPELTVNIIKNGFIYLGNNNYITRDKGFGIDKFIHLNVYDTSFEDFLYKYGVEISICTETPGKKSLEFRACMNYEIIKVFINGIISSRSLGK